MTATANIYRLCPSGEIAPGMEGATTTSVRVGPPNDKRHQVLDFRQHAESYPRISNGLLLEGAPHESEGRKAIIGRAKWPGALLSLSTFRLEFDPGVSSHIPEVQNAWSGLETLHPAFVQIGGRSTHDQHQLVAISDGKFAIVADRGKRYMRVDCKGGSLSTQSVQRVELAQLLVKRAELFLMDNAAALAWTWHTLEKLGMLQCWPRSLEERLAQLRHNMLSSSRC